MRWLHEHGVISNYDEYVDLPLVVLEDARLFMTQQSIHEERERQKLEAKGKGKSRG